MIAPRSALIGALACLWGIGVPALLLAPAPMPAPARGVARAQAPLPPPPMPAPPVHLFTRALFAAPGEAAAMVPADAPHLNGIAGRLGDDAVALVRTDQGATRTLAIGDSIDGWRLESLSIDAALFVRGGQRARVPLSEAPSLP